MAESYEVQLRARLSEVVCKKGCHHCCYHPVYLTVLEGIALYQALQADALWTRSVRERFQEVSNKTWRLAPEVWSLSLIPCPLLDEKAGTCQAYEHRPFQCRITYAIGDPQNCHPHHLGPGMLPRRDLMEGVAAVEAPLLLRHHLRFIRLPLATAVLFGEKIAEGELELEDGYRIYG